MLLCDVDGGVNCWAVRRADIAHTTVFREERHCLYWWQATIDKDIVEDDGVNGYFGSRSEMAIMTMQGFCGAKTGTSALAHAGCADCE